MAAYGPKLSKFSEFGRKIIGVARNYRDHAAELGNVVPTKPLLFFKPPSAYITEGQNIKIPRGCTTLHHEVELGVVIQKSGSDIPENEALDYIGGYVLALDMTARDFQNEATAKGLPWALAKGFDTSCAISDFLDKDKISDHSNVRLWLKVNEDLKQDGNTKDMISSIPHLISYISQFFSFEAGDLILTGTPAGVGAVKEGDIILAGLDDKISMEFLIEQR